MPRLLRTVGQLTARQVLSRVRHVAWLRTIKRAGPLQRARYAPDPAATGADLRLAAPEGDGLERARALVDDYRAGRVSYLAQEGSTNDWHGAGLPKLWRYERQYHKELVAFAALGLVDEACAMVANWAVACPPTAGDAWEPYPVARRVLAWAEAMALAPGLRPMLAPLLLPQLRLLSTHLEWHLLGNHLICDAAALVAGGAALEAGAGFAAQGAQVLQQELARQVLPDGGYAERTALYHALVARDSLLALSLARQRGMPLRLEEPLSRMLRWLSVARRRGGELPCLNDSTPQAMFIGREALARGLELELLGDDSRGEDVSLPDTGWSIAREGRHELLFEHGPLGPAEQPGHGHSDALSYELLWDGARVVVDSGVSTYDTGPLREFERSARAHATVTVDGQGPDELWAAFRAGGRGQVTARPPRRLGVLRSFEGRVQAFQGWTHDRKLHFAPGRALVVVDRVQARPGQSIVSRVPLAPGFDPRALQLVTLHGARLPDEEGSCAQAFGKRAPRQTIAFAAGADGRVAYAIAAPGAQVSLDGDSVRIDGEAIATA